MSSRGGRRRVQVAVVGAGPAGLVLANVLHRAGIDVRVWERFSRAHVERRARAGLLEHRVVDYLREQGLAERLLAEARRHGWCDIACLGDRVRVDYQELSGGAHHWIYPQQLLVRDLIAELDRAGRPVRFGCPVLGVEHDGSSRPVLRCAGGGEDVESDYVVGCDGAQGVVAGSFPAAASTSTPAPASAPAVAHRRYPYDWLTVLAEVSHPVEGVLYSVHESGFAGMMPRAGNVSRLYLEVPPDDDCGQWPEDRIRSQLTARLALRPGDPLVARVLEVGMVRLRGRVNRRLRYGRLFLAGDAAHVLTPSGAKGLNLAVADAADLADALIGSCRDGDTEDLDGYEARRLRGTWQAQEFSDRLLDLLHLPSGDPEERAFGLRLRHERVRMIAEPGPQARAFARDYAGAGSLRAGPLHAGPLHAGTLRAGPPAMSRCAPQAQLSTVGSSPWPS